MAKEVKAFEYVIILQAKRDKDGEVTEEAKILDADMVLATDEAQATLIAGRKIPEERLNELERVTLGVRPF